MNAPNHPIGRVLIAGGGPTGMVLALMLHRHGIGVRIVDKAAGPGLASRAMVVHARSLELYRQIGLADAAVARGVPANGLAFWRKGRRVAGFTFGDAGKALTPYPFVLILPQDDHERFLIEQLAAVGIEVEREIEVGEIRQTDGEAVAVLTHGHGTTEEVRADYLCGCDGAHSAVRHAMGVGFEGGAYEQVFYVADADVSGPVGDQGVNVCVDADGFCLVMPVRATGGHRLIGIVPEGLEAKEDLAFADIEPAVESTTGLDVKTVRWFSRYRSHHRLAGAFRQDRLFLLGDAGHIHSPAGGQGLNTGVGDAVNLAWKLAMVLKGRAPESLLDTYDTERRGFAQTLVATTDRLFKLIASRSGLGTFWRLWIMPRVAALVMNSPAVRRNAFRAVSQTAIAYPGSRLSAGHAGRIKGGDRLPWVAVDGADNHAPLASDWRLQVYGETDDAAADWAAAEGLPLDAFHCTRAHIEAGFTPGGVYLVRPDGYVACAAEGERAAEALVAFADERSLRFRG